MMMSFCKKSVHSFLSFSMSKDNGIVDSSSSHSRNIPSPSAAGLTFFTVSNNTQRPINVVESAALKSPPSSPTTTITTVAAASAASETKRDLARIGFLDDVGGNVDGLMSCTESLGFESSDERRADNKIENFMLNDDDLCSRKTSIVRSKLIKKTAAKRVKKSFPPPLSSLNQNGKPNFFLRPVRRDGRLELTEVKIHRPEILRSSRQDGRLRLNFICEHGDDDEEEEEEEEEETQEGERQEVKQTVEEVKEEKGEDNMEEGWRFPVTSGSLVDGVRRCHEFVTSHHHPNHQYHHDLHVWRPGCPVAY